MLAVLHSLGMFIFDLFKPRRRLEAENLFLRHQLNIALRRAPSRLRIDGSDRALIIWMTCSGRVWFVKCKWRNRKRSFGGTAQASRRSGGGSPEGGQGGRRSIGACAS